MTGVLKRTAEIDSAKLETDSSAGHGKDWRRSCWRTASIELLRPGFLFFSFYVFKGEIIAHKSKTYLLQSINGRKSIQ